MNELVRKKLREIISQHGESVCHDPALCEDLLLDSFSEYQQEISVLVVAVKEQVPADLLALKDTKSRDELLNRLIQRLSDNFIPEKDAEWAVKSWALALGVPIDSETMLEPDVDDRRGLKKLLLLLGFGFAFVLVSVPIGILIFRGAPSVTITVSQQGGRYTTIGKAIQRAKSGDRIKIQPGHYNESLVIDKDLEIIGEGLRKKIVIESTDGSCIQIQAQKVTVRGLTLRGQTGRQGKEFYTVDVSKGHLTLEDCDITSDSLACIAVHNAMADIQNCHIHDGNELGIWFYDGGTGTVEECIISGNQKAGVLIGVGGDITIRKSKIHDGKGTGVFVYEGGRVTITDSDIFDNQKAGVAISRDGTPIIEQSRINRNGYYGILVYDSGTARVSNSDLRGNVYGAQYANTDAGGSVQGSGNKE